ncbi:MAG: hypothetical protein J7M38_01470 [Armatimonadetes bacterium]|nr:hypothetical protein [Armatimonadota bacterium]
MLEGRGRAVVRTVRLPGAEGGQADEQAVVVREREVAGGVELTVCFPWVVAGTSENE